MISLFGKREIIFLLCLNEKRNTTLQRQSLCFGALSRLSRVTINNSSYLPLPTCLVTFQWRYNLSYPSFVSDRAITTGYTLISSPTISRYQSSIKML
eukprot:sb/3478973/